MNFSALDFYSRNLPLTPLNPFVAKKEGVCISCSRTQQINAKKLCQTCCEIKSAYKGSGRLSAQTFCTALIFEGRAILWSSMEREHVRPRSTTVEVRKPSRTDVLRELMNIEDGVPYLYVVYGDSNEVRDLRLNHSSKRIKTSFKPHIARKHGLSTINLHLAQSVHDAVKGRVTGDEFDRIVTMYLTTPMASTPAEAENVQKAMAKMESALKRLPNDFVPPFPFSSEHIIVLELLKNVEEAEKAEAKAAKKAADAAKAAEAARQAENEAAPDFDAMQNKIAA